MSGYQDNKLHSPLNSPPEPDGFDYPLRVLLYSHDSVGLGHLRRNLAIAGEIADTFPNSNILIVTGSPCATQFQLPPNTDLIKIPTISKDRKGRYVVHNSSGSLDHILKFRSKIILDAFHMFEPTLVIVDHQLTGLKGEALDMLRAAKKKGVLTIYGSRDIKDSPEVVQSFWDTRDHRWALNEGYDQVCIYGVPEVFDPRVAYAPFLDKVKRVDFVGYIVPAIKEVAKAPARRKRKKVLVTFGGGGDGAQKAKLYLRALATEPANWDSHIITGPLMEPEVKHYIRSQARKIEPVGAIKVQRFHRNIPDLLNQVDAVVGMAGYNSCAEILQSGIPAVLLPRVFPRKEQLIRAERMAELGWVSVVSEVDPDPRKLFAAVKAALASPRRSQPATEFNGLSNLCDIILQLLKTAGLVDNMTQLGQQKRSAM